MPDTAEYHRSFLLYQAPQRQVDHYPAGHWNRLEAAAHKKAHERRMSMVVYQLQASGLKQVKIAEKPDQNFVRYATPWERTYSRLCGAVRAQPVVNQDLEVVGHIGWYQPEAIFVQLGVGALDFDGDGTINRWLPINEVIEQHGSVRVGLHQSLPRNSFAYINPDPRGHVVYHDQRPGPPTASIQLLTDKDGTVVLELARQEMSHFLAPPAIDPFVLAGVGKLVYTVGRGLGSRLIRHMGARAAGTDLGAGATGRTTSRGMGAAGPGAGVGGATLGVAANRTGSVTVDEMEQLLTEVVARRPELRRLMAAQTMTGQGRLDAIRIAWQEWERTTGWKVVEKTAQEMQAVTSPKNLMTLRSQTRELWINKDRAFRWDPDELLKETAHEFAAHALAGRGGTFTAADLAFIGQEFTRFNNALFILEHAVVHPGGLQWAMKAYR